jgi:RNA polymerase sigma-70 factor, ECF subfamily
VEADQLERVVAVGDGVDVVAAPLHEEQVRPQQVDLVVDPEEALYNVTLNNTVPSLRFRYRDVALSGTLHHAGKMFHDKMRVEPPRAFLAGDSFPASHFDPATSLVDLRRLAARGDRSALEQLLRRVQRGVQRYLQRRLPDRRDCNDLADDLRQEVLIRAVSALNRATFEDDRRLLAWLLVIARNVLMDHYRAERRRPRSLPPAAMEALGDDASLAAWLHSGGSPGAELLDALVSEALRGVPERTQELVRLRVQMGHSWSEVGAALGTSASAAKRRFQRAQAALRRRILVAVDNLPPTERARLLARGRLPDGRAEDHTRG